MIVKKILPSGVDSSALPAMAFITYPFYDTYRMTEIGTKQTH